LVENTLNWQVGKRLEQRLKARGINVVMTKSSIGQMVTNRQRAEIANRNGAAIMIRIHCDAGGGTGYTWYYPDRSGTKYGVTGPPKDVQAWSRQAARVMNDAMKPVLAGSLRSNPIRTDAATGVGGRQGGVLTGSIFSRVPTALIEMCYITQKRDARFIASDAGQDKMAKALEAGVVSWRDYYLRAR
jgi:N-acetylmuramoyl-L-alanine amidase